LFLGYPYSTRVNCKNTSIIYMLLVENYVRLILLSRLKIGCTREYEQLRGSLMDFMVLWSAWK
jgi:hypothetical protein